MWTSLPRTSIILTSLEVLKFKLSVLLIDPEDSYKTKSSTAASTKLPPSRFWPNLKLSEAINQIENLTKGKIVNEKQVLALMRYYELIKEIRNVHKG